MPHLDVIRDENTHKATAQTEMAFRGEKAFFTFIKENDGHSSHQTQPVFEKSLWYVRSI